MKTTRIQKILKFILILSFGLEIIIALTLVLKPLIVAADTAPLIYQPQVTIPVQNSPLNQATTTVTGSLIAEYIQAIYSYGMMAAGILAAIVLMGGGLLWLTSAGNDSKITQAKELISGSIIGLVILFGSWILLNTINPNLLKMQIISPQAITASYFQTSGFYENLKDLPADMTYGWQHLYDGQDCSYTNPPTINLANHICLDGKPTNSYPANQANMIIACCGTSALDVSKSNICGGKIDGTACRVNSTAGIGSGYCHNNTCQRCKASGIDSTHEGEVCSNHYECRSTYNTCGTGENQTWGYCYCNVLGNNCTCRFSQPLY